MSYPPSHRNVDEPQPEVCDLCGLLVGGNRLITADVEGLRGRRICVVTPGCREFRSALSFRDRQRGNGRLSGTTGSSRIFEPGAEPWW
jgi:hypothetical protein